MPPHPRRNQKAVPADGEQERESEQAPEGGHGLGGAGSNRASWVLRCKSSSRASGIVSLPLGFTRAFTTISRPGANCERKSRIASRQMRRVRFRSTASLATLRETVTPKRLGASGPRTEGAWKRTRSLPRRQRPSR
jgi:hypothetical protein